VRQRRTVKIYPFSIAAFSRVDGCNVEGCGKGRQSERQDFAAQISKSDAARVVVDASTDEKFPTPQKIKFPITFETFARLPVVASVPELVGMLGRFSRDL
jgi:hypothetical protein